MRKRINLNDVVVYSKKKKHPTSNLEAMVKHLEEPQAVVQHLEEPKAVVKKLQKPKAVVNQLTEKGCIGQGIRRR